MPRKTTLPASDAVSVLLAEYQALYGLIQFRLEALDRRVPAIGAVLTVSLASVPSLTAEASMLVLLALPISLIWVLRLAINHTRSFEDALRRIEWIETEINGLANADLLGFQRHHPSGGRFVGGRTGMETIQAVSITAALMLAASLWLAWSSAETMGPIMIIYPAYVAVVVAYLLRLVVGCMSYRYVARSNGD